MFYPCVVAPMQMVRMEVESEFFQNNCILRMHTFHPVAVKLLQAYSETKFFRSMVLCRAIAETQPNRCLRWALDLIEPIVACASVDCRMAFATVKSVAALPDSKALSTLDDLGKHWWRRGEIDENGLLVGRAVARLAWAGIGLISLENKIPFASDRIQIDADDKNGSAMSLLTTQSSSAIDMIYMHTYDGRRMIATTFTREMQTLPTFQEHADNPNFKNHENR